MEYQTSRRRVVLGLTLALSLLAAARVSAEPLDAFAPQARPILVEFEVSSSPGAVGVSYSAPRPATYSVTAGVGTVALEGSEYETYLDSHGAPAGLAPIPGTFSDYVLQIDLTTLEAQAQVSGVLGFPTTGLFTSVSTTSTGGYAYLPDIEGPLYCDPAVIPGCVGVPGAPYDPQTGKLNAVGYDRVSHHMTVDFFSYAGDVRLSEVPTDQAIPALPPPARVALVLLLAGAAWSAGVYRRASEVG